MVSRQSSAHQSARIDTIALHPLQFLNRMCRGSSVVERRPEKAGVASSILAPGTIQALYYKLFAACATLYTNLRARNGLKSVEAQLELALASNTQCLCQERLPKRCAAFDVRCRG